MEKEDELAVQLTEIHRKIHAAEISKQQILARIHTLKEACLSREISHMEYLDKMNEKIGELSLPDWVEYYENYQQLCMEQLENRR